MLLIAATLNALHQLQAVSVVVKFLRGMLTVCLKISLMPEVSFYFDSVAASVVFVWDCSICAIIFSTTEAVALICILSFIESIFKGQSC